MNRNYSALSVIPAKAGIQSALRLVLLSPLPLLLALFCLPARADSPGQTGAEFLKIGVGARATALGGSYAALADDVYSLYWNPAGLARIRRYEAAFQVNDYFQDIRQHFLAAAKTSKKYGSFGIGLNLLGTGDIPRTTVTANGAMSSAGSFSAEDLALIFGYARPVTGWCSAGGTLKWIRSSIANYDADAFALDAGVQIQPISALSIGFAVQNLGTRIGFIAEKDELPMLYRLGVSGHLLKNRALALTMDLSQARSDLATFGFGCEYTLMSMYSFRLGYTTATSEADRGLTAGFGLRFKSLQFEYAFVPFGALGDAHRYNLKAVF